MIKYYCNRKEDTMTNYFLLVMENGEPLQDVEEFMEIHNLNDLIEKVLNTEDKQITLENAIEFINDDELVEITPDTIRLRKKGLTSNDRRLMYRNQVKVETDE